MQLTLSRLVVVIVAITLLRLVALWVNGTDLFFDESQYWAWSRDLDFGYYSKPPLIAWIISSATSFCGNSEFCIRLPSPLIHATTTLGVFALARHLYSDRIGFWAAVVFATLPGVSFSSGIISTDVPLLLAWVVALYAFVRLVDAPSIVMVLVLGLALGFGLNAKYAMVYFVLCAAVYFWLVEERREALKRPHLWLALLIGIALITPNLFWNAAHGFATFSHTADNAKWGGSLFHPLKALEFLGSQFGVFGPILFAAALIILWRMYRGTASLDDRQRLLLAFSLPVILIVTIQAFISRAHPNWAAVAYVPLTIFVTAYMLDPSEERWFRRSLVVNVLLAILIALGAWQAGHLSLPGIGDPYARTLGNRELARETAEMLRSADAAGTPFKALLSDDRELTASLLYYGRSQKTPLLAWRDGKRPRDHFELDRPYDARSPEPVLLVSRKAKPAHITDDFGQVTPLGPRTFAAGDHTTRTVHFFALSGYRGPD